MFVSRVQERLRSPAPSENVRCARMVAKTGSFQGLQDQVNVWPSWQALCGKLVPLINIQAGLTFLKAFVKSRRRQMKESAKTCNAASRDNSVKAVYRLC